MQHTLQEQIEKAHQEWMAALDIVRDPIFMHDNSCRILRCNRAYQRYAGLPFDQIIGRPYYEVFPLAKGPSASCRGLMEQSGEDETEEEIISGGHRFRSRSYAIRDQNGAYRYSVHILEDITEQRRAESACRESELKFQTLFEKAHDGILLADAQSKKFVAANTRICEMLGYEKEKLLRLGVEQIHPADALPHVFEQFARQSRGEIELAPELPVRRKDGSVFFADVNSFPITLDGKAYLAGFFRDVTERLHTENALRDSEAKFRSITASAQDAILMMDHKGEVSYWNEAAEKMFGYAADEALGKNLHTLLAPERFHAAHKQGFAHFLKSGVGPVVGQTVELAALRRDGTEFPIELSLSVIVREGHPNAIGIIRDISERKSAETALYRANRALKTLSAVNLALVKAENEESLLQKVTSIIVDKGGYGLTVVDYALDIPDKPLVPVAWSSPREQHYWIGQLRWDDTDESRTPAVLAVRTGTTQICRKIGGEGHSARWSDAALERGYRSTIALPLNEKGKVFGVLSIYSQEAEPFDTNETYLLEELAGDLAFGLNALRTRNEHETYAAQLRSSLEQSIQTIAATLEARDPYTAGHQRRVAELATAIAREMELEEEQVQGIHFAAIIHDLGKINVPAEILAKPGQLNEIEYMLIQTHAQAGYEILKEVRFPWPIADIIRQHHEKVDGTGYPQGLKGNEILLEAKIIAVADVVEAISSHRPYRPALGIELAMKEVRNGRGSAYDPVVVDACLKVFIEQGFIFNGNA